MPGLPGPEDRTSRQVAPGVNPAGAAGGADLCGSSKYSREALEDRFGEGFRVNSRWTREERTRPIGRRCEATICGIMPERL